MGQGEDWGCFTTLRPGWRGCPPHASQFAATGALGQRSLFLPLRAHAVVARPPAPGLRPPPAGTPTAPAASPCTACPRAAPQGVCASLCTAASTTPTPGFTRAPSVRGAPVRAVGCARAWTGLTGPGLVYACSACWSLCACCPTAARCLKPPCNRAAPAVCASSGPRPWTPVACHTQQLPATTVLPVHATPAAP